ncbi:hypothetical protein B2J63_19525 [Acinetobacter baumannii]|nr:hypothetical protein B2J63_19525 [Acinetobacter baumannii]
MVYVALQVLLCREICGQHTYISNGALIIGAILNNFNFEQYSEYHMALLHKDLKVKTSHIYSNLSDNSGMWSA